MEKVRNTAGLSQDDDCVGDPVDCAAAEVVRSQRSKGLLAIGIFKLSKCVFFFVLGLTALHLVHRNIGEMFLKISTFLHFDPAGQFVDKMEDRIDLISGH